MTAIETRYVLDTSSLVAAWKERYPKENFPGVWVRLANALDSGLIIVPNETYLETKRRDDDLFDWLKSYDNAVVKPDDSTFLAVKKVMADFPRLVDTRTGKSGGDPWVIATALCRSPRPYVVTEEGGGSNSRPKIPTVCGHAQYSIPCTNLLGLIQAEKWVF